MATEFLLIAATLVELKSRRLLPGDDDRPRRRAGAVGGARPAAAPPPRVQDVQGRRHRPVGLAGDAGRSVGRTVGLDERFLGLMPDLLAGVTPDDLRVAFLRAIAPKPRPQVDLDHVAPIRASVTDAVAELVDELPRAGRITFRRLTGDLVERLEVVVRFLAVLELFKQGLVDLDQPHTFGDIEIVWLGRDARRRPAARRRRRL